LNYFCSNNHVVNAIQNLHTENFAFLEKEMNCDGCLFNIAPIWIKFHDIRCINTDEIGKYESTAMS